MAKIPPVKRITSEDFKDQSWIGKLLTPLNDFMSTVSAALNRGLTFADNISSQVKELRIEQSATAYPQKFLCALGTRPQGLLVVSVREDAGNPATLTSAVFADWDYSNGQVIINNFTGLTNGRTYAIRVIILAG